MIKDLSNICETLEEVDLKKYNTFKLESKCKYFCRPKNEEELIKLIVYLNKEKVKHFIIGAASNIILPLYYDGVIIKLDKFNNYEIKEDYVYAECGCMINTLASRVTDAGYAGLDFATGIPGTVGGSVYGNAGCYGSDISKILISARVFDGKKIKDS